MNLSVSSIPTPRTTEPKPLLTKPDLQEWGLLALTLLVGAFLRFWKLDQNGTGNPYYAAAVRSMLMNWHNFFFVSFDPVGFVTVDKPPVALWVQTAFAKVLGYRGFSLILPQILEGLGAVLLVYHLVRRHFGRWAALSSALILALMPVSVAIDRYNNTDACLVLVLLLSAWALVLATEKGNRRFLFLSFVLAGVGFNTKMMAAFVVLPAFCLVYLLGAPRTWLRRLGDLTLASVLLMAVALSWPLAVDLTPPEHRPFVGSTQDNSMIGLSLGWNGFQRLLSHGRPGMPSNARGRYRATPDTAAADASPAAPSSLSSSEPSTTLNGPISQGTGRFRRGGMDTGSPGPLRLADKNLAGQVAWFLPLAFLGFWAETRRTRRTLPLTPRGQSLLLWSGWFILYAVVFSFMRGAMHAYYLVLLAPPLAALAGIGTQTLWSDLREGRHTLPILGLASTAAWQAFIVAQYPDWSPPLLTLLLSGIVLALLGLFLSPLLERKDPALTFFGPFVLGLGLFFLLLCPAFWALTPVLGSGQRVEASPDLLSGNPGARMSQGPETHPNNAKLLAFLQAHRGTEPILLVSPNSQSVASIIIETGESVVALGGFMGGDPILTVQQFKQDVEEGHFRYMLLPAPNEHPEGGNGNGRNGGGRGFGGGFGFGRMGGSQTEIAKWVRENGKMVDPTLWRPTTAPSEAAPQADPQGWNGGFGGRRGGRANLQLYDLRPDKETPAAS